MTPPISIDGTDITGATIDGQDVQEITVDGDTVFTAGPESGSVIWYSYYSGDQNITRLDLSTPWDISTESDTITASDATTGDTKFIFLSADGTVFYESDQAGRGPSGNNQNVNRWSLSTPFDLNTAVFVEGYDFGDTTDEVDFTDDGLIAYQVNYTGKSLTQFDLSTPFDWDTRTSVHTIDNITDNRLPGVSITSDGEYLLVSDVDAGFEIYELSTPFALSSASLHSSGGYNGPNRGAVISNDGQHIAWTEFNQENVATADLATAFDLSSITNIQRYSTNGRPWGITAIQ